MLYGCCISNCLISIAAFGGVSCLRLFVAGSRRPQVGRCIQLHAFFVFRKAWACAGWGELVEFCSCPLLETSTISATRIRQLLAIVRGLHGRSVPWANCIRSGLFCNVIANPERVKQSIARLCGCIVFF